MRRLLLAACALLPLASCQGAPVDPATGTWLPQPGDLLFHAAGSWSDRKLDDEDQLAIALQGGLGMVAGDSYELGGDLSVLSFDAGSDSRAALLTARYNHLLQPTQYGRPYAGVHAGFYDIQSATQDGTDPAFGLHAGIRQWLAPGIGLYLEPRFTASHAVRDTAIYFGLILNLTPR